jgi:predicted cobalt transporter CbtA
MASLATQLSLWATIGIALGELLHRLQDHKQLRITEPEYAERPL